MVVNLWILNPRALSVVGRQRGKTPHAMQCSLYLLCDQMVCHAGVPALPHNGRVNPHNSPLSSGVGAHCIFSRASSHVLHYTRAVLYFTLPQEMHTGCANHFRRILKKKTSHSNRSMNFKTVVQFHPRPVQTTYQTSKVFI